MLSRVKRQRARGTTSDEKIIARTATKIRVGFRVAASELRAKYWAGRASVRTTSGGFVLRLYGKRI